MKVRVNDIVKNAKKQKFEITYADKKGFFLESLDGKMKMYESAKTFKDRYVFVSREALDSIGLNINEKDWIKDPSGKIVEVIEISPDGSITTGVGEVFDSKKVSVIKKLDREKLIKEGFREYKTGTDFKLFNYKSLNEAVVYHTGFQKGSTKILFLRNPLKASFYERNDPRSIQDINEDFVYIGSVEESDLDTLRIMMSEDVMSPKGEAKNFFERLGFDRCELRTGDMVKIEETTFIVTKFGLRTVNLSNISPYKLHSSLSEDHTVDDLALAQDVKSPFIIPGDWVKFGERDVAGNMKWLGSGQVIKVDGNVVTVEDEIGVYSEYDINKVYPMYYVNN